MKMTHKGENYSIKLQKYYFFNGTMNPRRNRKKSFGRANQENLDN